MIGAGEERMGRKLIGAVCRRGEKGVSQSLLGLFSQRGCGRRGRRGKEKFEREFRAF